MNMLAGALRRIKDSLFSSFIRIRGDLCAKKAARNIFHIYAFFRGVFAVAAQEQCVRLQHKLSEIVDFAENKKLRKLRWRESHFIKYLTFGNERKAHTHADTGTFVTFNMHSITDFYNPSATQPARSEKQAFGAQQCVFVSTFILFSPLYAQSGLGKFFTGKRPLVSTTLSFSARLAFHKMWRIKFFCQRQGLRLIAK